MAIKFFGAVLIIASCIMLGFHVSSVPLKRKRSLSAIDNCLEILENEIEFSKDYIDIIISRICSQADRCPVFKEVLKDKDCIPIGVRWKNAVKKTKSAMCLNDEDCEVLSVLSSELGITGRDAQLASIRHVRTLLKLRIRDAESQCLSSVKLYRGLFTAAGIFLAVLLF